MGDAKRQRVMEAYDDGDYDDGIYDHNVRIRGDSKDS